MTVRWFIVHSAGASGRAAAHPSDAWRTYYDALRKLGYRTDQLDRQTRDRMAVLIEASCPYAAEEYASFDQPIGSFGASRWSPSGFGKLTARSLQVSAK